MLKKLRETLDDVRNKFFGTPLDVSESDNYEKLKQRGEVLKSQIEKLRSDETSLDKLLKKDKKKLEKLQAKRQSILNSSKKENNEEAVGKLQAEIDELTEVMEARAESMAEKRELEQSLDIERQRIYNKCQILLLTGHWKDAERKVSQTFESAKSATAIIDRVEKTVLGREAEVNELFKTASKILAADLKVANDELNDNASKLKQAISEMEQILSGMDVTAEQIKERIEINTESINTWISRAKIAKEQDNIDISDQSESRAGHYDTAKSELEKLLKEHKTRQSELEDLRAKLEKLYDEIQTELASRWCKSQEDDKSADTEKDSSAEKS